MRSIIFTFLIFLGFTSFAQQDLLMDPHIRFTPSLGIQVAHNYKMEEIVYPFRENNVKMPNSAYFGGLVQFNERRVWLSTKALFFMEAEYKRIYSGTWDISADYRLLKAEPVFVNLSVNTSQQYSPTYKVPSIDGDVVSAGLHYNNLMDNREYNQIFNLYGQMNYIIYGEQTPVNYPFLKSVFTNSVHHNFGLVINIKDFLFLEQNAHIYTEPKGWVRMNPFFSLFETRAWIKYKKLRVGYYHVCYHTFIDGRDEFPIITGGADRWEMMYRF